MKKPKISLDSAKLKALFFQHVEKLLLVVVVGMMLFLVYQGFSMSGLEPGKTPQGLLETSQAMLQFINDSKRWDEIKAEREVTPDVRKTVADDRIAVDANQYFLSVVWDKPNFPKLSPRTDPKLFAPLHLVVRPIVGPLAYLKSEGYVNPLDQVPVEDEEAVAPKKKAKPKAKPKAAKGGPPGMLDPMGAARAPAAVAMMSCSPGINRREWAWGAAWTWEWLRPRRRSIRKPSAASRRTMPKRVTRAPSS